MSWIGDFPEDFTTVVVMFTTHDTDGAPVAPLSAFETADVKIYKNGSASQKTAVDGLTMTSPFDSIVGLHCLVIDTSNDTNDVGFWVTGASYTVILNPSDETVNGEVPLKVIGTFGICLSPALRPTTAGRTLDVTAGGEAGVDWANVGSPTTTVNLSGTTVKTATDVEADTADIQARLPAALVSGRIDASVGAMAANTLTASALATDAVTEIQSGLATGTVPTAIQNADALLDRTAGVETNRTLRQAVRLMLAVLCGKASGLDTTTAVFRDTNDTVNRISATVTEDGNRTAVTLDAS